MWRLVVGACVVVGFAAALAWQLGSDGSRAVAQEQDKPAAEGAKKPPAGQKRKAGANARKAKPGALGKTKIPANAKADTPPESAAAAGVPILSNGDSYDDFASIVQTSDGSLFAAYAAYYDGHDQIRLHKRLSGGKWSTRLHVPLVRAEADIWMPQLAVDKKDRVWVIWCEQTDQTKTASGNWDVYARAFENDQWGPIVRLSTDPKPDINPHVATDVDHNIYVVWQGHPENNGDIMLSRFDGQEWSKPQAVTSGPESDWYPQVAVDVDGTAWIAFDSYRNGDYDVFLTSVNGDRVGSIVPIATSKYYEAHPTVACAPDGQVWVAWEQGGFNWGKDNGYWLRVASGAVGDGPPGSATEAHPTGAGAGSPLGSTRTVQAAVYHDGKLLAAPDLAKALPTDSLGVSAMPALAIGSDSRVWLRYRRQNLGTSAPKKPQKYWTECVSYLTADGWSKPTTLAGSTGRISVFSRIKPLAD
ncbi:MAG TPA: hypothetical protein VHY20_08305, partial [Pirellulales bacterium]|nr:hypothetical protein [Pirellulales bacterium]